MRSFVIALLLAGLLAGGASGAEPVIRSVPALCAAVRHPGPQSRAFDIEAVVTDVQDGNGDQFTVTADGANIMITDTIGRNTAWFHPGDRIRAGQVLCEIIHPLEGEVLSRVTSPVDGRVFFAHHSPLVKERGVVYKIITGA